MFHLKFNSFYHLILTGSAVIVLHQIFYHNELILVKTKFLTLSSRVLRDFYVF